MAYATSTDLSDTFGFTPNNAQVLLDRASRDIDRALQTATYDVDGDGLPTDAAVAAAFKAAVVEQVAYYLEQGNKDGIRHGLQSGVPSNVSAGEIALSRGPSVGGDTTGLDWLGDQAQWILRSAPNITWGPIPV